MQAPLAAAAAASAAALAPRDLTLSLCSFPASSLQLAADAAEKAPGSVDAPIWAIVVGEREQVPEVFALAAPRLRHACTLPTLDGCTSSAL